MIRVHRIPFSTNVERVALAAGVKGIEVEWADHDPADRSAIVELSGQELVPVAELNDHVWIESMRIVEVLDSHGRPTLYPTDPAKRARLDIFIEWFNHVWKGPPNELDAGLQAGSIGEARVDELVSRVRGWSALFEAMLAGSPYLGGDELGAADVCAFPFLKYAVVETPPDDVETFHPVLERCLKPADAYPSLCEWVRRVDTLPRA